MWVGYVKELSTAGLQGIGRVLTVAWMPVLIQSTEGTPMANTAQAVIKLLPILDPTGTPASPFWVSYAARQLTWKEIVMCWDPSMKGMIFYC